MRLAHTSVSLLTLAALTLAGVPQAQATATPVVRVRRWFQIGPASWYGRGLEGRRTASGERFHAGALTCAHPSLPLGSWIRVTNLRNRRSVFVRVTDRGPEFGNRIVDLSSAAARAVGIHGVGRVGLEPVTASTPELARGLTAQMAPAAGSSTAWSSLAALSHVPLHLPELRTLRPYPLQAG